MRELVKINIEGNPLRSIKMSLRTGGTNDLKKHLQGKIDPEKNLQMIGVANGQASGAKQKLIEQEFMNHGGGKSQWTQLIREFKNTNGDLDLRQKNLTCLENGILEAVKVNRLNLDQNKIEELPGFLSQLDPVYLSVKQNLLTKITPEFISFKGLREIDLSFNKISSFLDRLTSSEAAFAGENFLGVTNLALSQNRLTEPPKAIALFENLKCLSLGYNQISDMSNLFQQERANETIEIIDISNNQLTRVPINIWKWQRIHTLNFDNNNISNFAPELGCLDLKNLSIAGNPSMLIKNQVSKNTVNLMAYLQDRLPENNRDMEAEIQEIRQRLSGKAPKTKKEIVPDYEYNDPFKAKVDSYNKKEYNKYSGVDQQHMQFQQDHGTISNTYGQDKGFVGHQSMNSRGDSGVQNPFGGGHEQGYKQGSQTNYQQYGNGLNQGLNNQASNHNQQRMPQNNFNQSQQSQNYQINSNQNDYDNYNQHQNNNYQQQSGYIQANPSNRQNNGNYGQNQPQYNPPVQQNQPTSMPSNKATIMELDRQIAILQDEIDNDYNMSRVIKMQKRRDLNKMMSERNQLAKN